MDQALSGGPDAAAPSTEGPAGDQAGGRSWFGLPPDVVIGAVLVLGSFALRFTAYPRTGLFHDDAWVAVSAEHASLLRLPVMSLSHPGFSAALRLLGNLPGEPLMHHTFLPFVAGVLGPVALFATLRHLGFHRVTSLAAGVVAAFSITLRAFSGRVKPYTVEFLAVLVAFWVVGPLSRREWTPRDGLLWALAAVLAGTFSGVVLVITAVMGVIFVVTASSDRSVRLAAVLAQAVIQAGWVLVVQSSYDSETLSQIWDERLDLFIDLSVNPIAVVADTAVHVKRSLGGLTNGGEVVLWLLSALLIAGLLLLARKRPEGWLAGGLFLVAVVGAMLGQIPFGGEFPRTHRFVIWLFPVFILALAQIVDAVRRKRPLVANGICVALVLVAVVGGTEVIRYRSRGMTDAAAFIEQTRTDDTLIFMGQTAAYPYAEASGGGVAMANDPDRVLGFTFRPLDPDVGPITPAALDRAEELSARVVVFFAAPMGPGRVRNTTAAITSRGFCESSSHEFDTTLVLVFEKQDSPC